MPLHMQFGADDLLRCRFAISPLCETHGAVRTLKHPDRQGYHAPWLRRIHAAADGLDLRALWLLMPRRGYSPDFLGLPPSAPFSSVDEELARLRATRPEQAAAEIRKSLVCTPGAMESAAGRAMLADPQRAIEVLADTTERAWHALIAADWPRLRALLEAEVAFRSRQLADGGLERLFADLHPRLTWSHGSLTVRTPSASVHERILGGDGMTLMPSVFVWPDVVGGFDPPWQATVVYPARGIGGLWQRPGGRTADALARLLGPNRAAILTDLDAPASTTALAHRHRLAVSSVSAQLAVLREAGLVTSRRQGLQVLYERTPLGIALVGGGGA
ncbi:ArsR/SmtB family transcription factor [Streptomyces zagrosensis]|uniref:ArsR/SmtB family transcription factor n=1 Tax=Streptomyces zagrosensis TaxID=1042984 RepID=UPI0016214523|nr:DUF5937 family protein [Streptomyces zagrosensis]